MKVKVFDESHEKDLENAINEFLENGIEVVDIKFSSAISVFSEEQIFCFSALVIYKWWINSYILYQYKHRIIERMILCLEILKKMQDKY